MTSLKASLKKLIGRVKEMAAYWTSFGAMLIPIAIIVRIESTSLWAALGLAIFGLIAMGMGLFYTYREDSRKKTESNYFIVAVDTIHRDISKLIEEIRQDRNARNNPNNRTDKV